MPELKEPNVCEGDCKHTDCASLRDFVNNAFCALCNKKVEAGQAYYDDSYMTHAKCLWETTEKSDE